MKNLVPKAIAYTRDRNVIENHDYQAWLQQIVEKEDLIAWAQKPDERHLRDDIMDYDSMTLWKRIKMIVKGIRTAVSFITP